MAYDPCSCQSQGELEFIFTAFSELNVDIIGRSVAIDVPIDDDNYTTRDFLNMSHVTYDPNDPGSYEPGTEIYQNMDRLADDYKKKKQKYLDDLDTYNQITPLRMALEVVGLNAVGQFLASGITNITLTEDLYKWIKIPAHTVYQEELLEGNPLPPGTIELPARMDQVLDTTIVTAFTDKAKKEIGRIFGNFSAEIFNAAVPGKPKAPTVPAATLEESVYKGKITAVDITPSSPLLIPGALPGAYPLGTTLEPHRLPIYNEVLGQSALLQTPKPITSITSSTDVDITLPYQPETCEKKDKWTNETNINFRFNEELLFALNPALDFDMENTSTSVQLQVIMVSDIPSDEHLLLVDDYSISTTGNLQFDSDTQNASSRESVYTSVWIDLEELNQYVFSLSRKSIFDVTSFGYWNVVGSAYECGPSATGSNPNITPSSLIPSIKITLKVMHDLYFHQIGTSTEQINVVKVHSYILKDPEQGVDNMNTDGPWSTGSGYFDLYIPDVITLGNETITTAHPLVHEVIGNEIIINAQEVNITGPLQVQSGYTVVIQALEQIHSTPDASFNPKIHKRIKKDFYNTPVFEYANNDAVASFCNNSNAYQANFPTAALQERINQQLADEAIRKNEPPTANSTSLLIFPNPARSELTLRATGGGLGNVTIYDTSGRPVMQANAGSGASEHRMDIGALAPGIYIVQAACSDEVHSEKLVVAR